MAIFSHICQVHNKQSHHLHIESDSFMEMGAFDKKIFNQFSLHFEIELIQSFHELNI
jgi:hypothetical protein